MKSNEIWRNESNYNNWELRKHRFTVEMRPIFFKYLGITPNSGVLDAGCGTGVLTRYIAHGVKTGCMGEQLVKSMTSPGCMGEQLAQPATSYGKIIGFDISKNLVDYGNARIADEKLSEVCKLIEADGFQLPFEENAFDAVTNYTYLGVLSDPVAGLKEMIRVCKSGGTVSTIFPGKRVSWKGEYPSDFNCRLDELYKKQEEIFQKHIRTAMYFQSSEWHSSRYPEMFDICGLKNIHIYSIASAFSYSDSRWPIEYRKYQIDTGISDDIRIITQRSEITEYEKYGFTKKDFAELIELLKKKQKYLLDNIEIDMSFELDAGHQIIVTGIK